MAVYVCITVSGVKEMPLPNSRFSSHGDKIIMSGMGKNLSQAKIWFCTFWFVLLNDFTVVTSESLTNHDLVKKKRAERTKCLFPTKKTQ